MNRLCLAIGAGLIAVIYGSSAFIVLLAAVPAVLLAMLFTGVEGIDRVKGDPEHALLTLEAGVLGWWFFASPGGQVFFWLVCVPVILVLWLLSLGATPYPPLPPRR